MRNLSSSFCLSYLFVIIICIAIKVVIKWQENTVDLSCLLYDTQKKLSYYEETCFLPINVFLSNSRTKTDRIAAQNVKELGQCVKVARKKDKRSYFLDLVTRRRTYFALTSLGTAKPFTAAKILSTIICTIFLIVPRVLVPMWGVISTLGRVRSG